MRIFLDRSQAVAKATALELAKALDRRLPVTRFLTEDTIEKRIASILEAKRKVFNDLLSQADKPANIGLTEDEIFGLFDLQARPKRS